MTNTDFVQTKLYLVCILFIPANEMYEKFRITAAHLLYFQLL